METVDKVGAQMGSAVVSEFLQSVLEMRILMKELQSNTC
jgi:hypothetical protein